MVAGLPEPPSLSEFGSHNDPRGSARYLFHCKLFLSRLNEVAGSRKTAVEEGRGRDKLNEPKEKTRPSLLSYTLERAETFG